MAEYGLATISVLTLSTPERKCINGPE